MDMTVVAMAKQLDNEQEQEYRKENRAVEASMKQGIGKLVDEQKLTARKRQQRRRQST